MATNRAHLKGSVLVLIFSMILFFGGCGSKESASYKMNEFMESFNEYSSYSYNGSVLVAKSDEIVHTNGYGMADFETGAPNLTTTVFPIGSITKSFTATAILQLCEDGKLNVDDSISLYLNGNEKWDDITIHHLLTHTSGLQRDGKITGSEPVSLDENVAFINKQTLLFSPGEDFSYSNAGYNLLAAIIEKVTGRSYSGYLEENIFKPLEMNDTWCGMDNTYGENQALGYVLTTEHPIRQYIYNFSMIIGSGNICSTVVDLHKYVQGLFDGTLISEASLAKMLTPHYGDPTKGYGYGWEIAKSHEKDVIRHGGNIGGGGYISFIAFYPEEASAFIFLTNNGDHTALDVVANSMESVLFDEPYVVPEETNFDAVDPEILQQYAGDYTFREVTLPVLYENGKLYSMADDGNTYELLPIDENTFLYEDHQWIKAKFVEDGEGMRFVVQNINNIFEFVRLE